MKFEKNGMKFEVSNLDHIVINTVRQVIKPAENGKPARVTNEKERNLDHGTRVWYRYITKHGIRWAKFRFHGPFPETVGLLGAEMYQSHEEITQMINRCMHSQQHKVWFSGTYCNIEITENYQEVQRIKAQEDARKLRARQPKRMTPSQINDILHNAISSAGAQVRQEAINTPFGLLPVMTITGSGRRKHDRM